VHDGQGGTFLLGTQSVYLHHDLDLRFATLSGDGTIASDLPVTWINQQAFYAVPAAVNAWLETQLERPPAMLGQTSILVRPAAYLEQNGFDHFQFSERPGALLQQGAVMERFRLAGNHDRDLTTDVGDFTLNIKTDNALTTDAVLGHAQRAADDVLIYLEKGTVLEIELGGSSQNTNTLGFVRMDIDPVSGARSVGGVAYGDTVAFRTAVLNNLDSGFTFTDGGIFRSSTSWTVAGDNGYYSPVLQTFGGDVFVAGNANPGGAEQARLFGHNTFGFEELTGAQGADFDYNDMVVTIAMPGGGLTDDWLL
jgi:hypothetical protein